MSKSQPNVYAPPCRSPHHILIRLRDHHCQLLKAGVMGDFVFTDSAGTEHPLVFRGDLASVLDVPAGVGTLRYTGPLATIAECCGFTLDEDGEEKDKPDPDKLCSPPEKIYPYVKEYRTHHARYPQLHKGVKLEVPPSALYIQHTVLVDTNRIDWIVLMAFIDNHSGEFHGSGHFGCMIIDGRNKVGRYADFGKYHMILKDGTAVEGGTNKEQVEYKGLVKEEFDMVRVGDETDVAFDNNGIISDAMASAWSSFNEDYGSMIAHHKKCTAVGLKGPRHEMTIEFADDGTATRSAKIPYAVNGINAWAAIPLRAGAYADMNRYVENSEEFAEKKWKKAVAGHKPKATYEERVDIEPNDYSVVSFNCMTFCLCVYEVGVNPNATLKANLRDKPTYSTGIDHPNKDIMYWMGIAKDKGFFNDRCFKGEQEAVTKRDQSEDRILRHTQPELVSFP
ncbi:MAG: hypothetical protein DELT_02484 [Desulfovibrio sp.]